MTDPCQYCGDQRHVPCSSADQVRECHRLDREIWKAEMAEQMTHAQKLNCVQAELRHRLTVAEDLVRTRELEAMADKEAKGPDAERYRWLRARDLETVHDGGVFAGRTPENLVLNGEDLDIAIDEAMLQDLAGE